MQNRNTKGQYSHKTSGKAVIWLIATFILIGAILIAIQDEEPSEANVETATFVQELNEDDKRIQEYLKSEEAKLQAKLAIYEQDRVNENTLNTDTLKKLEAEYQEAVRVERARHADELKKIEANLDGVRSQILGNTTKSN